MILTSSTETGRHENLLLPLSSFYITNDWMFFIILDNVINFIKSVWWGRSFVFLMMQIKVISNWAKVIIKSFCNFFVFLKSSHHCHSKQYQYQPCHIYKKIGFTTYSKQFAVSRVEIFRLSWFIQVNRIITLVFKITNINRLFNFVSLIFKT